MLANVPQSILCQTDVRFRRTLPISCLHCWFVTATMNTYGNKRLKPNVEKKVEEDEDDEDYEDPNASDDYENVEMEDQCVYEQGEVEDEDDYENAEDYMNVEELGTACQDESIYANC